MLSVAGFLVDEQDFDLAVVSLGKEDVAAGGKIGHHRGRPQRKGADLLVGLAMGRRRSERHPLEYRLGTADSPAERRAPPDGVEGGSGSGANSGADGTPDHAACNAALERGA